MQLKSKVWNLCTKTTKKKLCIRKKSLITYKCEGGLQIGYYISCISYFNLFKTKIKCVKVNTYVWHSKYNKH